MDMKESQRRGSRRPAFTLLLATAALSVIAVITASTIFFLYEYTLALYYITLSISIFLMLAAIYAGMRTYMQLYPPNASTIADMIERGLLLLLIVEEALDIPIERVFPRREVPLIP